MSEGLAYTGCEGVDLDAYVDGELALSEREGVERHLGACEACRAEVELLRLMAGSLRHLARLEPSEAMHQRLIAQVEADLAPRRIEIFSVERHGDRVTRRREVILGQASFERMAPEPLRAAGAMIVRQRQERSPRPGVYQVITTDAGWPGA
jgi:anti-sigma factor RsiW